MRKILSICLVLILVCGCRHERTYFPQTVEPVAIDFVRFDSAILSLRTAGMDTMLYINSLYENFEDFMPVFCEDILGIDPADTAYLRSALPKFIDDTLYGFRQTNERVALLFKDISPLKKSVCDAFSKLKYLYPELVLPEVTLFISGFNASVFFWESERDMVDLSGDMPIRIAVGTDMYLGQDYEYYNRVVYNYQKQTMRPECIPADIVSAYLFRTFPYTSDKNRLLENMLYRGKLMYLLSAVFPDETEAEVMGYTTEQWQWAKRNEAQIWQSMLDKRDLFKTESPVLSSYLNDGPFTAEVSQDSPPRLGTWVGMQIVRSYMENNPQVTMQELLLDGDAQHILELSKYRP